MRRDKKIPQGVVCIVDASDDGIVGEILELIGIHHWQGDWMGLTVGVALSVMVRN